MQSRSLLHLMMGLTGILGLLGAGGASIRVDSKLLRAGIPEGAAGLVTAYVLQTRMETGTVRGVRFEQHTLYDCCAVASQYALGTGHLDLAIMCPDAANTLVEKDERFEIVGPVMMNGDVFVIRPSSGKPSAVGISQKREYQRQMVAERFGERYPVVPMLHAAVPFVFARHEVDAVVVDIVRALRLAGDFQPAGRNGHDVVTAVLVVKKAIKDDERYRLFIEEYADAVRETAEPARLLRLLQLYASDHISFGDVLLWNRMNVRFVNPFASRPLE